MKRFAPFAAVAVAALLGGCAVYPDGTPMYSNGYSTYDGYYDAYGAPVPQTNVYMGYSNYYGPGYYESGYAYEPGYAYDPGYVEEPAYAYEPAPVVAYGSDPGWDRGGQCWISTDQSRGFGYYGPCAQHNEDQFNARQGDFRTVRSRIKP